MSKLQIAVLFGGASSDGKGDTYRFNTSTGKTEALSYTLWGKGQETAAYGSSAGNRFYAEYVSYDDDITYETFKSIPVKSAYRTFKVKKSGKGSGTVTGTAGVKKLCEMGVLGKDDTVVTMISGNGLKDVANAIKACGEPISIPSDMDLLLKAFAENGIHVEED